MYLITVEGGDGSGKGLAARIVAEVIEKEFTFTSVEITGEPRRDHPLGRLAIDSVRKKIITPEGEAGLFAADRLDHSHGWILPRLREGRAVVSERNVHSSLVYQGIVGKLGIDRVAHINSAALIPDLCIWVDCDPEVALERIESETLRNLSNKKEYFETSNLQEEIREGYRTLLSGEIEMPTPFDMGALIGPILNESTEVRFRQQLSSAVKNFLHSKPNPINVDTQSVEMFRLNELISAMNGQTKLKDLGLKPLRNHINWLDSKKPWQVLQNAQNEHTKLLLRTPESEKHLIPKNILNHSISSICGTLSLMDTAADISELRKSMGPVRNVSASHTRKIIKFLHDHSSWISKNKTLLVRESTKSYLKDDYRSFGKLLLAIWPLRRDIKNWQRQNPKTHLRYCLPQILKSGQKPNAFDSITSRLKILGIGNENNKPVLNGNDVAKWWQGN